MVHLVTIVYMNSKGVYKSTPVIQVAVQAQKRGGVAAVRLPLCREAVLHLHDYTSPHEHTSSTK